MQYLLGIIGLFALLTGAEAQQCSHVCQLPNHCVSNMGNASIAPLAVNNNKISVACLTVSGWRWQQTITIGQYVSGDWLYLKPPSTNTAVTCNTACQ